MSAARVACRWGGSAKLGAIKGEGQSPPRDPQPIPRMSRRLLLVVLGLAACGPSARSSAPAPAPASSPAAAAAAPPPASGIAEGWRFAFRARITEAPSAVVVSGSPVASEVGREILRAGGNAVDAATAVGFALAVVHPEAGNIGGGGFSVIRLADGSVQALDYREAAPGRAAREMYLDLSGNVTDQSVTGHLAAGTPGAVAGLAEQHRRYGRLPWRQVIEPAIRLARDGFVVDEYRMRSIDSD